MSRFQSLLLIAVSPRRSASPLQNRSNADPSTRPSPQAGTGDWVLCERGFCSECISDLQRANANGYLASCAVLCFRIYPITTQVSRLECRSVKCWSNIKRVRPIIFTDLTHCSESAVFLLRSSEWYNRLRPRSG